MTSAERDRRAAQQVRRALAGHRMYSAEVGPEDINRPTSRVVIAIGSADAERLAQLLTDRAATKT